MLRRESIYAGVVIFEYHSHVLLHRLAYAAGQRKIPAHIVMPSNSPDVKKVAVRGYGAIVTECEPTQAAREAAAAAAVRATGGRFVHPSEDPLVIAGQGTIGLELLAQALQLGPHASGAPPPSLLEPRTAAGRAAAAAHPREAARLGYAVGPCTEGAEEAPPPPPLDVVILPVGGGGLAGGTAVALRSIDPRVRVLGAEPAGADDAARSRAAGVRLGHAPGGPATIADGLRTTLGERGGATGESLPALHSLPPPLPCCGLRPRYVAPHPRPLGRGRARARRCDGRCAAHRL